MESKVPEAKIKELIKRAKSAKVLPESKRCFDGNGDIEKENATTAYIALQKMGIEVEVEFDE